jgi:diacylglycerol kinase (ATP)
MAARTLLIANPQAAGGRARAQIPAVLEALRQRQVQADVVVTTHPGHAVELAKSDAAVCDHLVAVGGDGTVNEVATGILLAAPARAALGVVPLGTGNDVAHLLGVGSVSTALEALTHDNVRAIDVIEVTCQDVGKPVTRYALLFAAVGFAAELLRWTTPRLKRLLGPRYCYSAGFLQALLCFRTPRLKVNCDGVVSEGRMFLACAGNTEYAGGGVMRLSPGARIDDGKLNLSLIGALGRFETLRYFPKLLKGEHVGHPKLRYFEARTLAVEAFPVAPVAQDGDVFGWTPARFEVRPAALKVLSAR